jgi:hypothetical protein
VTPITPEKVAQLRTITTAEMLAKIKAKAMSDPYSLTPVEIRTLAIFAKKA